MCQYQTVQSPKDAVKSSIKLDKLCIGFRSSSSDPVTSMPLDADMCMSRYPDTGDRERKQMFVRRLSKRLLTQMYMHAASREGGGGVVLHYMEVAKGSM